MKNILFKFVAIGFGSLGAFFALGVLALLFAEEWSIYHVIIFFVVAAISLFLARKTWILSNKSRNDTEQPRQQKPRDISSPSNYDTTPASEYAFTYIDSKGTVSERVVIFRNVSLNDYNDNIYLEGMCKEKQAFRTFMAKSMSELVNIDTGECIINPFKYFKAIIEEDMGTDQVVHQNKLITRSCITSICFTGFKKADKEQLVALAEENGINVRNSVVKSLDMLCYGTLPAPAKREKAVSQGVAMVNKEQFENFIETGEIPLY